VGFVLCFDPVTSTTPNSSYFTLGGRINSPLSTIGIGASYIGVSNVLKGPFIILGVGTSCLRSHCICGLDPKRT
jgi:hypothetical protein